MALGAVVDLSTLLDPVRSGNISFVSFREMLNSSSELIRDGIHRKNGSVRVFALYSSSLGYFDSLRSFLHVMLKSIIANSCYPKGFRTCFFDAFFDYSWDRSLFYIIDSNRDFFVSNQELYTFIGWMISSRGSDNDTVAHLFTFHVALVFEYLFWTLSSSSRALDLLTLTDSLNISEHFDSEPCRQEENDIYTEFRANLLEEFISLPFKYLDRLKLRRFILSFALRFAGDLLAAEKPLPSGPRVENLSSLMVCLGRAVVSKYPDEGKHVLVTMKSLILSSFDFRNDFDAFDEIAPVVSDFIFLIVQHDQKISMKRIRDFVASLPGSSPFDSQHPVKTHSIGYLFLLSSLFV